MTKWAGAVEPRQQKREELIIKPTIKDTITIYHGDAMQVLRALPDQLCDALITDPPYAAGQSMAAVAASTADKYTSCRHGTNPLPDFFGDGVTQRVWRTWMADILYEAARVCRDGAALAVFCDWRQLPNLTDAIQLGGWVWRGVAVWDKTQGVRPQKGRYRQQAEFVAWGSNGKMPIDRPVPVLPGVWTHPNVATKKLHQTQKPLGLMRDINRICVPGGTILDPFCGSGTTLEAARIDGYSAIGIERVAAIARVAADRLGVDIADTGII